MDLAKKGRKYMKTLGEERQKVSEIRKTASQKLFLAVSGERSGNPSAGRGIRRQTAETGRDTPFENIFLPFCKRFTNKINTYNQQITNKLPNFTRNKLDIFHKAFE